MALVRIHHIALTVREIHSSEILYDNFLGALGYKKSHSSSDLAVWIGEGPEVLLYVAEDLEAGPQIHGRPGLQHIALEVDSSATVKKVFDTAVSSGATAIISPQEFPEYSDGYFAAFFEDPDGNRFEAAYIPAT